MKALSWSGKLALLFLLLTWAYFLFALPTFDFDESLYRRVAEEMKLSGKPWQMTWDHWPVYHKPPLFYWLICGFSYLVDGANSGVSSLAARLPNFFASIGILTCLYWSERKWDAVLAFTAAVLPVLTATTVIFDPLQTLCLMPSLLVPTFLFYRNSPLRFYHYAAWSMSLSLACAVKGLNGLIIPSLAFGIHLIFKMQSEDFRKNLSLGLRYLFFVFLPASLLIAAFYFVLDRFIGRNFTHEFLWVQHFERSQNPMEDHSGFAFYHWFVVFLGGSFLIPWLGRVRFSSFRDFVARGFPLTYAFSFILVFSFSATKLPHYTWPVWPALALFFGLQSSQVLEITSVDPVPNRFVPRFIRVTLNLPVLFLGMGMLALASDAQAILGFFARSEVAQAVLHYFSGFRGVERGALYFGAVVSFYFLIQIRRRTISISFSALCGTMTTFCLVFALARPAQELMVIPFREITTALMESGAKPEDCIRSTGAQSPTFSLALGNEYFHNRCEPGVMKYLIAPEWKAKECEERGMTRLTQKSYLVLCVRK